MSWFSIANNLAANEVNLELSEHQSTLATSVRDLSSGLEVNNAADDPAGYAIATALQTHAQAFSQASQNVANAQNAGTVADGALAGVTDVLLRIRELAVGAASSIDSSADRVDIQAEISQLLIEINRIAQNTNFNGRSLLDGSIAGYQSAQSESVQVTANSYLADPLPGQGPTSPSALLIAAASPFDASSIPPSIFFRVLQSVTPSSVPQTVDVSDAGYIQPGSVFTIGGSLVQVQSVDAAAGTMTAVFASAVANGDVASPIVSASLAAAVPAGTQIATLSSAQPLYAGETLQVNYNTYATNDVVVVQQVLSSTSFIATFNKAQPAGTDVFSVNGTYLPANFGPGDYTWNYGSTPTDSAPIGSTAYVVETSNSNFPPSNGSNTQVVATGTVVAGSVSSTTVRFTQQVPNLFGGTFELITPLGFGSTPLLSGVDGTIELSVVEQNGTIGVAQTFYDTATQTSVTSPALLSPNEHAILYDGVDVTLGNVTAADVGSTAYIKILQSVTASTSTANPALSVQSGAAEGDAVQLGIPAVNTNTLRVSAVTVIGASGTDPTLASQDAIGQVDYALNRVTTVRAQIGAQIVRLGIDQTNDTTASTELTASQSNIVDLDVGEASTEFTEQQIDVQVATGVLEQVNALSKTLLELFPDAEGAP